MKQRMGRTRSSYEFWLRIGKIWSFFERNLGLRLKSSAETTAVHLVPVGEVIQAGKNYVLPPLVLQRLVEQADGIGIMKECMCRRQEDCRAFPKDVACLIFGAAARQMDASLCRMVSPEEALAHAARALELGLMPLIVHDRIDAFLWGVDFPRMLNVCFCCPCCCQVLEGVRFRAEGSYAQNVHRLPGLSVTVGDECIGCGTCQQACPLNAIHLWDGRAQVSSACKGCGRCAVHCPSHAIHTHLAPGIDTVDEVLQYYRQRVKVWKD